jgi:hypothetical protein
MTVKDSVASTTIRYRYEMEDAAKKKKVESACYSSPIIGRRKNDTTLFV